VGARHGRLAVLRLLPAGRHHHQRGPLIMAVRHKTECSRDPASGLGSCWWWWESCPSKVKNCWMRHMKDASLTLQTLLKMSELFDQLPPEPLLGSSANFPRDHALKFEFENRSYIGAHPDFWRKLPQSEAAVSPFQIGAIPIINLDVDHSTMAEFITAMQRSWTGTQ
jgi:hypothetical protein